MKLSTDFMGLKLKNPILVAAGPWSRNGEMIHRAFQAGAGAVVTESIVNEVNLDVRPRLAYNGNSAQNIRLYNDVLIEAWEREIEIGKKGGGIIIANVCAQTPSEISFIAAKMERAGADAIELGLSSPMGEGLEVIAANPRKVYEMTSMAVSRVSIPVMVKLSQNVTNILEVARAAERGGASAISGIDTVRSILGVDLAKRKPYLSTYGGYSGPAIKPLGLASIAAIAQSTKLPICGIGGIQSSEDVLEYMMLGADVVQIGTAVMINGFSVIENVKNGLMKWMEENDTYDLSKLKGAALSELKSFDEIAIEPLSAVLKHTCAKASCAKCAVCCLYDAVSFEAEEVKIDETKCTGCGLCIDICPDESIKLVWS